jgi:hypothetical protein
VLYHDPISRNVLRSNDEGKTWLPVEGVPSDVAIAAVEHPYDISMVR